MNRKPDRINDYGTQFWFDDQESLHNDIGYPATISKMGSKYWYKHGVCHNDFGPAIIKHNGYKAWYIDGVKYSEEDFKQYKIKNFIDE